MNEDPSTKPIPVTASQPLDLKKIADTAPAPKPISLADAVRDLGFAHCLVCYRGGHTGHTLYSVIVDLATKKTALACKEHVGTYLRPKDLKKC